MRASTQGLLFVSVLLWGCGRDDHRAFTVADSWYRPAPTKLILAEGWKELVKDAYAVVTLKEAKALAKLERVPWAEVTEEESEQFLAKPLTGIGGKLVLLRALSLNDKTGGFSITLREGAVRVHHGCLGRHPVPMARRALVARLPELPSEVYVDVSMAE